MTLIHDTMASLPPREYVFDDQPVELPDIRSCPRRMPDSFYHIEPQALGRGSADESFLTTANYDKMLRSVCFVDPCNVGVLRKTPVAAVPRISNVRQFEVLSVEYDLPSLSDAVDNRHLFDVVGETLVRINGNDRALSWHQCGQEYRIEYGQNQPHSYMGVICHPRNDVTIAAGQDRKIYMLDHTNGGLLKKSEKMYNTLFSPPVMSWTWADYPSLLSFAVGKKIVFYDFLVESTCVEFPLSRKANVKRVSTSSRPFHVAIHYDDASLVLFDVRKLDKPYQCVEDSTIAFDWQPNGYQLTLVDNDGKILSLNPQTNVTIPLPGVLNVKNSDYNGVFYQGDGQLYLTSSLESGVDCVDYFETDLRGRFSKQLHWETSADLLSVRIDRSLRSLYVSTSDCKIFSLSLPEKRALQNYRMSSGLLQQIR